MFGVILTEFHALQLLQNKEHILNNLYENFTDFTKFLPFKIPFFLQEQILFSISVSPQNKQSIPPKQAQWMSSISNEAEHRAVQFSLLFSEYN